MSSVSRKTQATLMVASATFFVSLAVLAGSWYWVDHMQTQLHETKLNTKRIQDEQQQLAALEKLALETKDERARLASYIVPDQGVIAFLSLLENVARQHNVVPATHTIATEPILKDKGFESLVVNISLTGALGDVKKVIAQYEHMPYQIRIDHVSIHAGGEYSASADMAVVVTKMAP